MNKSIITLFSIVLLLTTSCHPESDSGKNDSILLAVKIGEKYGFVNEKGKIVIEPQFDNVNLTFQDDLCFASLDNKKGLINKEGNFIVELEDSVQWVYPFLDGIAIVSYGDNKYNAIDKNGTLLFDNQKSELNIDMDGENLYFLAKEMPDTLNPSKKSWTIFDKNRNNIEMSFDSIKGFKNELCAVKINDKWGYINKNGSFSIAPVYDFAGSFSKEGIARVVKDSLDFYIDKKGKSLFPVDKALTDFSCNRAAVEINGKKYIIDNKGTKICEIKADEVFNFHEDSLATIKKDGKALKINTSGKIVLSTKYNNISEFINGVAFVEKNEKEGVIDIHGNEIISPKYEREGRLSYNESGISKNASVICFAEKSDNSWNISYFDFKGNLISKDMPIEQVFIPNNPTKADFVKYFDAKLSEIDPIEGIYYVTLEEYYQNRTNPNIAGLNKSFSEFFAVVKDENNEGYNVYSADGSNGWWVNKFVRIGESDNYAIVQNKLVDQGEKKFSSEGKFTLEDPYKFSFRLEQGHNNSYNFFVTYEFNKDYPIASEYEKIQKAEWTGTGFAIADGFIATNYHVISGAKRISIRGIDGDMDKSYKGTVVAKDKEHDLSIIKIVDKDFETMGTIPYSIGKTSVEVGENIFVLGYPIVDTMGDEVKLTEGIISSSSGYKGDDSMYQISAAVQPGNSGGPLFNDKGVIIGVVCAKHADAENANYAVKISYLYSLINSSKLGIKVADENINKRKLSSMVKKVKKYVYLIECSSK